MVKHRGHLSRYSLFFKETEGTLSLPFKKDTIYGIAFTILCFPQLHTKKDKKSQHYGVIISQTKSTLLVVDYIYKSHPNLQYPTERSSKIRYVTVIELFTVILLRMTFIFLM